MNELTLRRMKEFLNDHTQKQSEGVVSWGDRYFDAWNWMRRARWVFAQQYNYPYVLVDSVIGQQRRLHRDLKLIERWGRILLIYGDTDTYILLQSQQTPEQIDTAIDRYWKHLV